MIKVTILFKNGIEKVHYMKLDGAADEMNEEQKHEAVDEFAQLFSEVDTLRFSEKVGQRFHIDTKEVVYTNIEIIEQED